MRKLSLDALAREHIELAAASPNGRSSTTVYGGHEHVLRQTLVAMTTNTSLGEHLNPGEATVIVLRGRVRLTAGRDSWEARSGDLLMLPPCRHGLDALENSAFILTVAKPRS
jgi:quercetin dioxygenase-like cupin family protein